ncbi:hypothetical protein GV827_21970 [Sulfitobacter sp. JBTF-M27]|uniref:Uncharacterized protein n=1 Tax=Sulfitobacter sediminilitoris TaxID=2698830 RepID=A0A6P0CGI2_9RHOB|nr:hypothetical protein [Sulfitobacter sediminilitoris]NEK25037.1 hypothetical protein [Sulfitobacter sediminilitoris]
MARTLLVAPQRSTDINQNLEDYRVETGATVSTNTLLNEFSGAPDLVVERILKVRAILACWDTMIPEPGGNHSDDKRPAVMHDTGKKSDAGGITGSRRWRDRCMQPVDLRFVQAATGKNNRVLTIAFTKDRPNGFRQRAHIATIEPNAMQSDSVRTQKVLLGFRDAQPFKKNKALIRPYGHEKIPAFRQLADEKFKDGRQGIPASR